MTLIPELAGVYKGRRWRTRKRQMPAWADRAAMRAIKTACPAGHQIDHVIPLSGFTAEGDPISGLNIPRNLRYLPTQQNLSRHVRMSLEDQKLCEQFPPDERAS
jgi:hypothetical protein